MFTSIGPENALKKIQYPFLIKNQNNTTKMAIVRNVLNMKKKHVYVKTPKPERIAITKTCPDRSKADSGSVVAWPCAGSLLLSCHFFFLYLRKISVPTSEGHFWRGNEIQHAKYLAECLVHCQRSVNVCYCCCCQQVKRCFEKHCCPVC